MPQIRCLVTLRIESSSISTDSNIKDNISRKVIILQLCTTNDQMKCGSWDMECKFFLILGHFLPFYPLTTRKSKIFKKRKCLQILSFYKCTKNHNQMLYCSTDMACDRCNFYVLVWRASFCPFTPLTAQKIKIKNEKNTCNVPKTMIRWCMVPEIWCVMNEQMEKRHIEVGAPPKKIPIHAKLGVTWYTYMNL